MVNAGLNPPADAEVVLALSYAPVAVRPALTALWALDGQLASILRTTSDPMVGQLRLTWWHDALGRAEPVAGEPILAALHETGVRSMVAQRIVEGWEVLLDEADEAALIAYADGRGGGLFAGAADALGLEADIGAAGAGWALVDLARHHSSAAVRDRALKLAREQLGRVLTTWPRAGRPLGILAKLARRDLAGPERQGSPRRLLAAGWLALTGR